MAIAFDNAAAGDGGGFSYTVGSGSDRILVVGVLSNSGDGTFTGITYNGVALTEGVFNDQTLSGANQRCSLWYLVNPDSGANTLVTQGTAGANNTLRVASFSGAKQTGQPDATATGQETTVSTTVTASPALSVVAENSWVIAFVRNRAGGNDVTNNSGVTGTSRGGNPGPMYWDSNGTVSTGSNTVSFAGNSQTWNVVTMSIAPAVAAGPTTVKTKDSVTQSTGIKTYGVASTATTKSVNGAT